MAVITIPDIRWRRCDIKSLALLPNVLGKQQAVTAGAYEAWQVDEAGNITEGTSTNAWIVTAEGKLVTRPLGEEILAGIVRRSLVAILGDMKLEFEQRPFALAELRGATRSLPHQQQRVPPAGDAARRRPRRRRQRRSARPRAAPAHGCGSRATKRRMIAATPGYDLKKGAGGIGRPRALLFDWDNTLVDNWDVITDAMNAVYDAFGMPRWTIDEAKARIRSSMRDSLPARPSANGRRRRGASSPTTSPPIIWSGCGKCLGRADCCAALPAPACIWASSATSGAASCAWRPSAWAGRAISAGWSGPRTPPWTNRPSSRWIWPWRRAESARGADVWFVGDTDIDMDCAVNAGCLPVLVRREPAQARGVRRLSRPRSICGIAPGSRRDYMPSGFCRPRIYDRQLRSTDRPSFHRYDEIADGPQNKVNNGGIR